MSWSEMKKNDGKSKYIGKFKIHPGTKIMCVYTVSGKYFTILDVKMPMLQVTQSEQATFPKDTTGSSGLNAGSTKKEKWMNLNFHFILLLASIFFCFRHISPSSAVFFLLSTFWDNQCV